MKNKTGQIIDAPPACRRCGSPSTTWIDAEPFCDSCAHKEGQPVQGELVPVVPVDPLTLALQRGIDADGIAKIVGLIEGREAAEAKRRFSEAMVAAQAEMPVIVRDAKNSQTNSGYATLENVQKVAKPVYSRHGFALSFSEADSPIQGWKRTVAVVRHVGGHSEEHFVDLPVDGIGPKGNAIGGMNAVQGAISTGSYGQRVLLCRIFNITIADTDRDGQSMDDVLLLAPEQLSNLKDLIAQDDIDVARLCKWLGCESIETMNRSQYAKFIATYRQRKAVRA